MKKKKIHRRMKKGTKLRVLKTVDSILNVGILLFIFMALTLIQSRFSTPGTDYFIVNILFALSYLLNAAIAYRTDRITFIKNICFAVMFAAVGVTMMIMGLSAVTVVIMMESFLLLLFVNRVLAAITKQKVRSKVINIAGALIFLLLIISSVTIDPEKLGEYLLAHAALVTGKALGNIIAISFSRLHFSVLRKILRKTFAAEILFGLLLLIGSFSFVFQALEPNIVTYFDALWYCFAVVTTIGFGDLTVTTLFSRALSVILGIYGIIVVALITSIIVNFYNEVKNDPSYDDQDEPDQVNTAKAEEPAESASAVKGSGTQE